MADLHLAAFLPYRLSVLSNTISQELARAYQQRFGLSIPEWRVMAILGREAHLTALEIVEASAMDKVAVSRAVARLVERGLLATETHGSDRRRRRLALTPAGMRIYDEVVPLALGYERALLDALAPDERAMLDQLINKLRTRARDLTRAEFEPDASLA